MVDEYLIETFYWTLNLNRKPIMDNAPGGAFMYCTFTEVKEVLDIFMKTSRVWHTRN